MTDETDTSKPAPAMFRAALVAEVEGAAHFRWERVRRFPDDPRNLRSARALNGLARNLKYLPDDDGLLRRCFERYEACHREAGNVEKWDTWLTVHGLEFPTDEFEPVSDKRVFTQYGFHAREDGNVGDFLEELLAEIDDWAPEDLSFERWADGY